jgi:hypothetical protein
MIAGAFLVAAMGLGCAGSKPAEAKPPAKGDKMNGRDAVERHLSQRQPGEKFSIDALDAHAPGYEFFVGMQQGNADGGQQFFVVHDGVVVSGSGDPAVEIGKAYQALGVVEKCGEQSAENLARIALALLAPHNDVRVLDAESHKQNAPLFEGDLLKPPSVTKAGDGATVVFWSRTTGRGQSFARYELTVDKSYAVKVKKEQPKLSRK